VVPGDCARQDTHHPIRAADVEYRPSVMCRDFASSINNDEDSGGSGEGSPVSRHHVMTVDVYSRFVNKLTHRRSLTRTPVGHPAGGQSLSYQPGLFRPARARQRGRPWSQKNPWPTRR
jgi:hypothetical protein